MSNQNVNVVDVALTITRLKEDNDKKDKLIYDLRKRNHELLERNRYLEQYVECKVEEHGFPGLRKVEEHGFPGLHGRKDLIDKVMARETDK